MDIYIASSWKNKEAVRNLAEFLRSKGFEVDDFTDDSRGRYVFHWMDVCADLDRINAKAFMEDGRTKKACNEDIKLIKWCDVLIMLCPCGKSSHLEAGYAKGLGKKTYLFAPNGFPPGDFEVMYCLFNGLYSNIDKLHLELVRITPPEEENGLV